MSNINTTTSKQITIRIADQTGHTTLEQGVDEAIQTITEQHYNAGKWVFIGSKAFTFTARNEQDTAALLQDAARLKTLLEEEDTTEATLTGSLVGGAIVVAVAVTGKHEDEWSEDRLAELVESLKETVSDYAGEHDVSVADERKANEEVFEFDSAALDDPRELLNETIRLFNEHRDTDNNIRVFVY